jgi:hypothetical protein
VDLPTTRQQSLARTMRMEDELSCASAHSRPPKKERQRGQKRISPRKPSQRWCALECLQKPRGRPRKQLQTAQNICKAIFASLHCLTLELSGAGGVRLERVVRLQLTSTHGSEAPFRRPGKLDFHRLVCRAAALAQRKLLFEEFASSTDHT